MKKCLISRRSFLKTASTAFAVPFILPSSIWNAKAEEKPNNRLNIGFIGIGMQNRGHLGSVANRDDARVIAVCDVDTDRLNYAKGVVDNRYKERFGENAQKCDAYYDFREMLSRKDLDAVFIATPDHWHSIPVIMAANAGKHIYCEKPLSLTVRQARAMANAVRKNDVIFQTGSQQRSSAEFRKAARMVRNGKIGDIKKIIVNIGAPSRWCDLPAEEAPEGLHWDMWLGPAPYRAYNQKLSPRGVHHFYPWRDYREYSGGMTTDWGCHHYDIVQWALGMDDSGPVKFVPPGNENATSGIKFYYANGVEVQHGGDNTLERDGKKEGFGIQFIGTEGRIYVDRGKIGFAPEELEDVKFTDNDVKLYESNDHHQDWFNGIRNHTRPICDVEVGCRSVTVCHLCNIAYWTNKEIHWDPKREVITNNEEANKLLDRKQRAPYCDWIKNA